MLQVSKLLLNAHVERFGQLCSLLGVTGQSGSVLKAVQACGVLVQGCWVVKSDLLYPEDQAKRNARDYIVSVCACVYCSHLCSCGASHNAG